MQEVEIDGDRPLIIYQLFYLCLIRPVHVVPGGAYKLYPVHPEVKFASLRACLVHRVIAVRGEGSETFDPLEDICGALLIEVWHAIDDLLRAKSWVVSTSVFHLILQFERGYGSEDSSVSTEALIVDLGSLHTFLAPIEVGWSRCLGQGKYKH